MHKRRCAAIRTRKCTQRIERHIHILGEVLLHRPGIDWNRVARLVFKLNFYQLCGLIAGSMTNPAALAYAQGEYGTEYTSVYYATVYPLSMFLRVLAAQMLILFSF